MYHRVSNIHTCIRQRQSVTIRYYLLCQQTPIVTLIDASHITPITCVNQGPKLLKLIGLSIVHTLDGSHTYPEQRPRLLALNQALPQGSQEYV